MHKIHNIVAPASGFETARKLRQNNLHLILCREFIWHTRTLCSRAFQDLIVKSLHFRECKCAFYLSLVFAFAAKTFAGERQATGTARNTTRKIAIASQVETHLPFRQCQSCIRFHLPIPGAHQCQLCQVCSRCWIEAG